MTRAGGFDSAGASLWVLRGLERARLKLEQVALQENLSKVSAQQSRQLGDIGRDHVGWGRPSGAAPFISARSQLFREAGH